MASDSDAVMKAAKILGTDKDTITSKMEKMNVNDVIDLLDAISSNDVETVKQALGDGTTEGQEDKAEFDLNPLFSKKHGATRERTSAETMEEEDVEPNMGDDVRVEGDDAIVKIPQGPKDTVGVQIDGQTVMVKKDQVKRVKTIEEGVVGVSPVAELRRMQELAGMSPSISVGSDSLAAGPVPMAPPPAPVEGPPAPAALVPPCPVTPPAPAVEVEVTEEPSSLSIDEIMSSFDMIEDSLPEIKLGDAKDIRARINQIMMKLNESLDGRKKKI